MKSLHNLLSVLLFFCASSLSAHSVQVQYCVNCNGDLRIWVEHWHGAADPGSTNMTISLDVNGTTTQQTSAPGGGVQNTAPGNLPGCSTPITYGAGCPGSENTYNDWVFYDFNNIPQNVPVTFTIISGNTVFTEDACGMFPLAVTFTIEGVGQVDNQDACTGQVSSSVNLPGNSTWTNDNPAIGIPPSGSGPINSFTPIGPVGTTANISYQSGCGSGVFTYTIQPAPTPTSSASSGGVNSTESCLGTPFIFIDNSTVPAPYVINGWLWDFGDGTTDTTQNPNHTYAATGDYTVTFTALSDIGCGGSITFPVVVNEVPVAIFSSDVVCESTATTFTNSSTVVNSNISIWNWDILNDGSLDYITENPTHTFPAAGTYDVGLVVVSSDGCASPVTVNTVNVEFNPVASFSSDSVCVGDVTTLIDASSVTNSTISNWNMSFGDGNTGNASPAPNVYPNPGNYTAQLQVTSAEGCTNTVDGNVYVRALPVSEFSIIDVCFYETVTTNNNSSIGAGTMIYAWDFGDATPLDFNLNPTHNYLTSGVYNVTLAATSNFGCTHDTMMQINIYDKPIADFSADGACLNDNSFFIDNSSILNVINADLINSWEWDMDGDLISNYSSQNPSHIYQAEGGHMTELIATTAFGCKDTLTLPVDVWPLPDVNFDFINLCLNDTTQFGDLSIISNTFTMNSLDNYNWNFDDGATSTSQNPAHVYGNYGDYNVSLNVISNNGCENNFLNVVNIRPLPFPNFTSTEICVNTPPTQFTDNTVVLFGNTSQWLWNFGDGNTSNSQNPSHIYNAEGTYQVELTATSAFGCVNDTIMSAIVYEKPTANFTSDITIACNPSDIMFADLSTSMTSNITGWEWSFGNGTTSTEQNPNINYVNENSESEYFDVELIVTNDLGCQDIIYVDNYIQIIPTPVASFTYSPTVLTLSNSETNFTNQSINSDEYLWNFGYDAPTSGSENPTHTFPSDESGSYEVQLTAYSYGQTCTDIAWATVVVEDVIVFYVPNVFTPDNDIFNQIWKPIFTSGYDSYDYHLILFNRWGETVWESYNAEEGWNGYYAGRNELVEDGVYVWTIEFKETMSDKRHKHDGFVTILK